MVTRVTTAQAYQGTKRTLRHPRHSFNIKAKPYAIQPFMIAPVLPGETMKNLLMQARVVSDPIKSPLVGWWLDYLYVYVKHRDLDERDDLTEMMLDPNWTSAGKGLTSGAASVPLYTYAGGMDWVKLCLKKVVDDHFRNEGEAWNDFVLADGTPIAGLNQESYLNSFMLGSVQDADEVEIEVGGDDKIGASEIDKALQQWQLLRMHNLTDMTYEDYLRTFGVRSATVELHRTEIIRVIREWTYPTNHVDPATGAPTSAVSWSIQERADKDRYFKEPGFIFGVTVARPKVYLSGLKGAGVGMLEGALPWLPALLNEDTSISLREFEESKGPAPLVDGSHSSYWIDVRDLFIYGDQFVNHGDAAFANTMALPRVNGNHRYVQEEMIANLFAGENLMIKHDGIVSLSIAGRQVDTTPGTPVIGT